MRNIVKGDWLEDCEGEIMILYHLVLF